MKIKMAIAKDNIERCIESGVYGTGAGHNLRNINRLGELEKGDLIILYASGLSKIAGIFEVTKPFYESNEKVWDDDIYPYRVGIKPFISLPKNKWLDIKPLVWGLDFFSNKLHWSLHFVNNLMPVNESDYNFIKSEMEKALSKV